MLRCLACLCLLLGLTACSQWQEYRCVRDIVKSHEPYPTPADRYDTENLARQMCAQRAAAGGR